MSEQSKDSQQGERPSAEKDAPYVAPIARPGVVVSGCCDACGGSGAAHDGPCWDCRGTGHPHKPDPTCATPPAAGTEREAGR